MTTRQLCVILGLTLMLVTFSLEALAWKLKQRPILDEPRVCDWRWV